jgi:gas vesicle protein
MSGDVKGGFESALAKAKEFVAEKGGQLKDEALSKVEDLKQQASEAVDSVKGQVSDAVDAVKGQVSDALDQAQSDIADRMATARQMAEDGVEDGFPEGESLLPQGAGADLRVSGTSVETVPEPETGAFGDTSSSISQSGNIMETSFGQTPPEDFAAATGEVSADDALSSLAKTASTVGETLGQTAAEAGTAVSGAVAAGTEAAVAAGTAAASGIADTVLAGLGTVAEVAGGPIGILVGIGASLAAVFEADKAPKALPDILNPSSQFGA